MIALLSLLSPQVLLIGALAAGVVAFGAGWKTRDAFCDAAAAQREAQIAQAQTAALQQQITAAHEADTALKNRTQQDREALEKIQGTLDGVVQKISTSDCFTATDTDKLRELWDPAGRDKLTPVPR